MFWLSSTNWVQIDVNIYFSHSARCVLLHVSFCLYPKPRGVLLNIKIFYNLTRRKSWLHPEVCSSVLRKFWRRKGIKGCLLRWTRRDALYRHAQVCKPLRTTLDLTYIHTHAHFLLHTWAYIWRVWRHVWSIVVFGIGKFYKLEFFFYYIPIVVKLYTLLPFFHRRMSYFMLLSPYWL